MKSLYKRHQLLAGIAAALLIGCSGGESGTGIQASNQTTVGEITGFGSVYVNGVKFNTDQASVSIDGISSSESNLSVGMVVTVVGSVNSDGINGSATAISSRSEVEGLVLQNNIAIDGTLNVMGQTVHISNDTNFRSEVGNITTIDQLIANDSVVEVSGYSDGKGNVYATFVKAVETGAASEVKLHGIVTGLVGDESTGTFKIGALDVAYDATTVFGGLTRQQLISESNLYVSIESGNYSGTGTILASEIERESFTEDEGSNYELEGIVTDIANLTNGEFKVNGRSVKIDAGTAFDGGNQGNIQLEVKLEVEGKVQADNSILADEISFRAESDTEIEGAVESIGDNMLTITGTVITVNEFTKYEDETDVHNRTFNFHDITAGMMIEAKYYVDPDSGDNIAIATSIEKVMLEP
jgi:cytoskeletal protein CcmA (bactofilin family)